IPSTSTLFPYTTLFRSWVVGVFLSNRLQGIHWQYVFDVESSAGTSAGYGCGGRWRDNFFKGIKIAPEWGDLRGFNQILGMAPSRSEEHTSELQSQSNLV